MSFIATMKNFFGLNGGTISSFSNELKALSHKEKLEFYAMLKDAGIECDPPAEPKSTEA